MSKQGFKEFPKDLFESGRENLIGWFVVWPFENPEKLIFLIFIIAVIYAVIKYL